MEKGKISRLALIGAAVSGIFASLCCTGPVILALLGITGAGIFSKFVSMRPFFIAVTLILLSSAFYLTYGKREVRCEDGTCRVEGTRKWNRIILYIAAFALLLLILFLYLNFTIKSSAQVQQAGEVREVVIPVHGMTCTGCESSVEMAIKKVPGVIEVRGDYQKSEVFIRFDSRKADVDDFKKAVKNAGYRSP